MNVYQMSMVAVMGLCISMAGISKLIGDSVYPFVIGDYLLFVGQSSGTYDLVILDVNTGRVVEQFTPDGEPDGFVGSALLFAPGFYRDGYIYLKTWTKTTWDPATRETIREEPAKIYVLKVRF